MSRANNKNDICELALSRVGEWDKTNVEKPETLVEHQLSLHYDQTRLSLLSEGAWNFALRTDTIKKVSEKNKNHVAYKIPSDFVNLVRLGEADCSVDNESYEIVGNYLYIIDYSQISLRMIGNSEDIDITYVWDFYDVSRMSPLFVTAFYLLLALNIYPGIVKKEAKQSMRDEFMEAKFLALSVDGKNSPLKNKTKSYQMEARTAGTHYAPGQSGKILDFGM